MRCLVIANELPWPLDHGGRLHAYEMCRRLGRRHELLMIAARRPTADPASLPFEAIVADENSSTQPDAEAALHRYERYFGIDPRFVGRVLQLVKRHRPDIVVGLGYRTLSCLARLRKCATICDLQDDEVLHLWRELRTSPRRWVTFKSLLAMAGLQRWGLRRVDAVSVLAEADQNICRWVTGHPRVACIPHGVDTGFYAPQDVPTDAQRIAFWGVLGFGPNASAIFWFYNNVWPLVRRAHPGLCWTILGPGDAPELRTMRGASGVEFMGRVDDIRPHVGRAAVAIVPMVSGGGIKNKIMEGWAMAKPVLCTRRALGSLPGVHGQNVWLADQPREMADGLIRLLADAELRNRLGRAGRATAEQHCSWDRAAEHLEQLCEEVVQRRSTCMEAISYATP